MTAKQSNSFSRRIIFTSIFFSVFFKCYRSCNNNNFSGSHSRAMSREQGSPILLGSISWIQMPWRQQHFKLWPVIRETFPAARLRDQPNRLISDESQQNPPLYHPRLLSHATKHTKKKKAQLKQSFVVSGLDASARIQRVPSCLNTTHLPLQQRCSLCQFVVPLADGVGPRTRWQTPVPAPGAGAGGRRRCPTN